MSCNLVCPSVGVDAVLAACDQCPLPVVSAQCTLGYLVPPHLLHGTLPVLGHHLQHPAHI